MYRPPHFREDRLDVLHDSIRKARLASLVTLGSDGIEASHLPLLLDPKAGPFGTLYGHLAKANAQWRVTKPEVPALAIFLGPDAYISPGWYPTKRETGKVVPTWNYVTVHASGPIEFFDDPLRLHGLVSRLTDRHESARAAAWAVSDAPEDYIQSQLKGIIGFALPIARLEGKWKLSQNRNEADRAGVLDGLGAEPGESPAAVAGLMRETIG